MGGKRITADEERRIRALHAAGHNNAEIARIVGRSREGVSRTLVGRWSLGKSCTSCAAPIGDKNHTGICLSCTTAKRNKDPAFAALRSKGRKEALRRDPAKYARVCAIARDNIRRAMADPTKRAMAVERGKAKAELFFNTPEMRAMQNTPQARASRGRAISERRMGWCPPAYREAYVHIVRGRKATAPEARAMILDQIEADKARAKAATSPFERQMRALERGATLIANDTAPTLGTPANYGEDRWAYGRVAG